jgi:hypothetical protein
MKNKKRFWALAFGEKKKWQVVSTVVRAAALDS